MATDHIEVGACGSVDDALSGQFEGEVLGVRGGCAAALRAAVADGITI